MLPLVSAKYLVARTPRGTGSAFVSGTCASQPRLRTNPEALAYLRYRLAPYDRFWPDPDRADGLMLHGSYDIGALRLVLEASPETRAGGYRPGTRGGAE